MSTAVICILATLCLQSVIGKPFKTLNKPVLPFTDKNAESYAIDICNAFRDFFQNTGKDKAKKNEINAVEAFHMIWGYNGDLFNDESVVAFDGNGNTMTKRYDNIKLRFCIIRDFIEIQNHGTKSCQQVIKKAQVLFTDNTLQWNAKHYAHKYGDGNDGATESGYWKFTFNKETGCIEEILPASTSGYAGTLFDLTVRATTSAVDTAMYIGLIEEQIKGSNENIKLITKSLTFIVGLVGVLFVVAVILCFHMVCKEKNNNKNSHKIVTMEESESDQI